MKILHCADLHLDSKMTSNLDGERARQRRGEILHTFGRMIDYAAENGIGVILIAGDMFDKKTISVTARNTVLSGIKNHPDINFYYLKGNHDQDNFLSNQDEIPENLFLFGDSWTTYREGNVVITGMEFTQDNAGLAYNSLVLKHEDFNIVMLHGQEAESLGKDKAEIINLQELRNKNIDYLALGHIHARKVAALDKRATMCYPGCLEGRGFDECGDHGFAVIDIDLSTGSFTHEFVNIAQRKLYEIEVDVNGCQTSADMMDRVNAEIDMAGCEDSALVKVVLTGGLEVDCEKDINYILSGLNRFYFAKIKDETGLKVDLNDFAYDSSLRGEFVRLVMASEEMDEEQKAQVIRYGIQALAGEEVQ